jgi:hypothetical protein
MCEAMIYGAMTRLMVRRLARGRVVLGGLTIKWPPVLRPERG